MSLNTPEIARKIANSLALSLSTDGGIAHTEVIQPHVMVRSFMLDHRELGRAIQGMLINAREYQVEGLSRISYQKINDQVNMRSFEDAVLTLKFGTISMQVKFGFTVFLSDISGDSVRPDTMEITYSGSDKPLSDPACPLTSSQSDAFMWYGILENGIRHALKPYIRELDANGQCIAA